MSLQQNSRHLDELSTSLRPHLKFARYHTFGFEALVIEGHFATSPLLKQAQFPGDPPVSMRSGDSTICRKRAGDSFRTDGMLLDFNKDEDEGSPQDQGVRLYLSMSSFVKLDKFDHAA